MKSILIVEDEKEIADVLLYALSSDGFRPRWEMNGQAAVKAIAEQPFDFIVLDVGLPDANGFELLKSIRTSGQFYAQIPCLFLTARNEEIDRIVGLEIGADDYVCKPFSPREVVARIKNILKRVEAKPNAHPIDNNGDEEIFSINAGRRQIALNGKVLALTKAEYHLLAMFLENPNTVFSRRELIDRVWSEKHPSDDRAIDTHIKTLRAKLKQSEPEAQFIQTHRGHGYSLRI